MNQNDNNLHMLKERLRRKDFNKIDLLGTIAILIISKEVFKKNVDASVFIEKNIGEKFPGYVIKSRTLMAARTCRIIINCTDEEIVSINKNLIRYLHETIVDSSENDKDDTTETKKNRKKNENEKLEKWLKGF